MNHTSRAFILVLLLCGCANDGRRTVVAGISQSLSEGLKGPPGYYRCIQYVPIVGSYLNLQNDGRYDAGPIGSALGGQDQGSWMMTDGKVLLKSDTKGETVARLIGKDGRIDIFWSGTEYVKIGPATKPLGWRSSYPLSWKSN
jgi:hypothetical protein